VIEKRPIRRESSTLSRQRVVSIVLSMKK